MIVTSEKDQTSQKIVQEVITPIYVNLHNDQSDIDAAKEVEFVNP